jgi:tight adherence protein C
MLLLVLVCVFIEVFLVVMALFHRMNAVRNTIMKRLKKLSKKEVDVLDRDMSLSLFLRIVRPILDKMSKAVIKATPKELVTAYEKKVEKAGYPFNLGAREWISIQMLLIVGVPLLTLLLARGYYDNKGSLFLLLLLEAGLGFEIPNFIISKRITRRQKAITNTLPDFIDLLTVCVEAGLGFDSALSRIIQKMPGPLSDEFDNMLREVKIGKQRRDALRDMAARLDVPNLTSFVSAVIQADRLGVSIGNVLRIQSEQMRENRRQRAREKALKAPVKMIIPMVIFIFPTIFSILLGPVVIKLIDSFLK